MVAGSDTIHSYAAVQGTWHLTELPGPNCHVRHLQEENTCRTALAALAVGSVPQIQRRDIGLHGVNRLLSPQLPLHDQVVLWLALPLSPTAGGVN